MKTQAGPVHTGCSVPEGLVLGGSVKPLGFHPRSQITHSQDALPHRNIGKEKVVTFPQSAALVAHNSDHCEQYLSLLLNDS